MRLFGQAKDKHDFCTGSMWDKMILYTLPIIFSNFMQVLYNAVDIAVVGMFTGEQAVASVGATSPFLHVVVNVFIGISVGASIRISYYLGAQSDEDVSRTAHTSIASGVLFGVIATVVGIALAKPVLTMMGTHKDLMDDALLYITIYFSGLIFTSIYNFGAVILRAGGDTSRPMYYLLVSGLANVAVNLLLTGHWEVGDATIGFDLGVVGVAVGTMVSQLISAILVMNRLMKTNEVYRISLRRVRLHKDKFAEIVRAGLPAGVQAAMFSFANLFVQSAINACDLHYQANNMLIAGYTASGTVEGLLTTCIGSFNTTIVTFSGQNFGAGKMDRVDRVPKLVALICFVIYIALVILVLLLAPFLVGLSVKDPMALSFGVTKMKVVVIGCIFNMTADLFISQSRALGNSFTPMVVSILCICVFRVIYLNTVYPMVQTYLSIVLIFPISYAVNTVFQAILYRRQRKRIGRELAARSALAGAV